LADGEAAGEWAADRVGHDELSDDLGRQLEIWACSAVAGRKPASAMTGFAGL